MKKEQIPEGLCHDCGKPIQNPRKNKIFCDTVCKNNWHKRNKSDAEKKFEHIIDILRSNRHILKKLLSDHSTLQTKMAVLEREGYQPAYLTHFKKVGVQQRTYYYTFDYGYRLEDDGITVTIVKSYH
jgi:hypothetical protein